MRLSVEGLRPWDWSCLPGIAVPLGVTHSDSHHHWLGIVVKPQHLSHPAPAIPSQLRRSHPHHHPTCHMQGPAVAVLLCTSFRVKINFFLGRVKFFQGGRILIFSRKILNIENYYVLNCYLAVNCLKPTPVPFWNSSRESRPLLQRDSTPNPRQFLPWHHSLLKIILIQFCSFI